MVHKFIGSLVLLSLFSINIFAASKDGAVGIQSDKDNLVSTTVTEEIKKIDKGDEHSYYIEHPNAAKGLSKITRDKKYLYSVKRSGQTRAASFRLGVYAPTELKNPNTQSTKTFDDLYPDNETVMGIFEYEWQFWQGFGKTAFKLGTGVYTTTGHGQFETQTAEPLENFTFILFPNTVGLVHRMQYWGDKQWIVPYVEGGGDVFTFSEIRDDGKGPKFGAALGAHFAFGGAINLFFLDKLGEGKLDSEYGINSLWLTAEFRSIIGFHDTFDFTSDFINAGFMAEF